MMKIKDMTPAQLQARLESINACAQSIERVHGLTLKQAFLSLRWYEMVWIKYFLVWGSDLEVLSYTTWNDYYEQTRPLYEQYRADIAASKEARGGHLWDVDKDACRAKYLAATKALVEFTDEAIS